MDSWVSRALFVKPAPVVDDVQGEESKNLMGYSLLISAVRCTLQYLVLPFILPLIGLAAGWALGVTMAITIVALIALITSLRRMWKTNYTHRWRYFVIAVPALVILVSFLVLDIFNLIPIG